MPSIALFIKQLLSEDKYGSGFSDRIQERIQVLNAAQLQGMYNHLVSTAKNSKSDMWCQANKELISKIENVLKERTAEEAKVMKLLEEKELKEKQKLRKIKEARVEQKRVMNMIASNARTKAENEVLEEETKRQAAEKFEIMNKVYQGEEKRNKSLKLIAVGFVIGIVIVSVVVANMYILIGCIVAVLFISLLFVYRAFRFGVVVPAVVTETELQEEIQKRVEIHKRQAISVLREKERKFNEQQQRDKDDRKKRKELRRNQRKFETELLEARRKEQLAMAKEVLNKHGMSVRLSDDNEETEEVKSVNEGTDEEEIAIISHHGTTDSMQIHSDGPETDTGEDIGDSSDDNDGDDKNETMLYNEKNYRVNELTASDDEFADIDDVNINKEVKILDKNSSKDINYKNTDLYSYTPEYHDNDDIDIEANNSNNNSKTGDIQLYESTNDSLNMLPSAISGGLSKKLVGVNNNIHNNAMSSKSVRFETLFIEEV